MRPLTAKRTPDAFCFHTAFHLQPVCQLFRKICIRLNGFGHLFNRSIHEWLGHPFIKNISPFKWIGHSCVEKHQPIWTTWTIFCQTTCIIHLEGSKVHSLKVTPFKQHQSSVLIFRRFVTLHGKTDTNAFLFKLQNCLLSVYIRLNGSWKRLNGLLIRLKKFASV